MANIVLGAGPDMPLVLDLPTLVKSRMLVQANSGGGKSWVVRRLLEQTFGRIQHIIIDPEGEFASLREKFDYVLAAPAGGDTAIDVRGNRGEQHTKLLAHRLLELNASAILDIYELLPADRIRFVQIFLDAMVDAPKALWHPVLVVLDEAHNFAPQHSEAASSRAVAGMASKGRKRGYCLVPATGRISKFHKDVAAECNNKLIGRASLDVDMKRAAEELGFTSREQTQELRRLEPGEFFAFGPALTPDVTRLRVGPVRTTHPEAGAQLVAPPAPTAKIRALLPRLADLPAEAETEARDNETLRRDLAEARRKLTIAERAQPAAPAPKPCEHPREIAQLQTVIKVQRRELHRIAADLRAFPALASAERIDDLLAKPETFIRQSDTAPIVADRTTSRVGIEPANTKPVPKEPRPLAAAAPEGELDGPEQRVLNAVAWLESIGLDAPSQTAVCFLAGYSWGGGFFKPRGSLNKRGLVSAAGDTIRLTDEGRALAAIPEAPLDTAELHRRILERLEGPERRVLEPVLRAFPHAIEQRDVCEAAGYSWGGGFFKPRGRLKSWGLIEYQGENLRAAGTLFPTGP